MSRKLLFRLIPLGSMQGFAVYKFIDHLMSFKAKKRIQGSFEKIFELLQYHLAILAGNSVAKFS